MAHGAYDKFSGDHEEGPYIGTSEYYQEEWRAQTTAIAILDKNNIELDEFTRENSKAYLEDTVNSLQRRNSDIDESKANQDVVDRLLYIENAGLRTKNSLEVQNVITGGHATDITEQYKTENLQRELEKSVPEANMQDRPFVPLGIPHFDIITYAAMYGDIAEQQRASEEVMASEFGQQNEARIALERAEIAQRELLEQQMAQQLQAQLQTELLEKMRLEKEALARTPSFNIPFTM